jgi:glutamine synthetase
VELRCPDPTCNPYLALALCLAAGLDGIEKGMTPPAEITENIFAMDEDTRMAHGIDNLPGNLGEAIDALCDDELMCDTLGKHVFPRYVNGKREEWSEYSRQVTDWEIGRYMTLF